MARDRHQLIDDQRVRRGIGHRGNDRERIHVGQRRAHKGVPARQNLRDNALAFARRLHRHAVADKRADALLAEYAARTAFIQDAGGVHIVKAAGRLYNQSLCIVHCIHSVNSSE